MQPPVCHRLAGFVASRWQWAQAMVMMTRNHKEATMSDSPRPGPVEQYLAAIEGATMGSCEALAPDVLLDATVPNWRFSVQGEAGVRAELSRWYADSGGFEELKRTPLPTGELIEFTLRWEEGGVPHAVHQ